jgi:hypothetical protein
MSRIRPVLVAALLLSGLGAVPASAEVAPDCSGPVWSTFREDKPTTLRLRCYDPAGETVTITDPTDHGTLSALVPGEEDGDYFVEYDPDAGYVGPDSFTLEVSADGLTGTQVIDLEVTSNRAPACTRTPPAFHTLPGVATVNEGNCVDVDWQDYLDLDFTVSEAPEHGQATVSTEYREELDGQDWASTYTPDPGYTGSDEYTITTTDGDLSKDVLVRVHVADGPWCSPWPEVLSIRAGTTGEFGPLCTQPAGASGPLQLRVVEPPQQGTAATNDETSIEYTPLGTASGPDFFTYQAHSPAGESNVVPQAWTVLPDAAPVCAPSDHGVAVDQPLAVELDCTDADDDEVTLATLRQPEHGTLSEPAGGHVTYTPDPGFAGTDRFTYTGADYARTSAPVTVRITVDDGKAPVLDLSIARGQPPRGAARHGLAYSSDNDEQIAGEIVATISGRTAKRLGLVRRASGPVRIAVYRSRYEYDTSVLGLLHLTDRAAEAIRPARRVTITVRFRGIDPLGNATAVTVRRTLRR